MVFICDNCYFEIEATAKPCQCPDCGKTGHIRAATAKEDQMFQARKEEDVWNERLSVLAG